MPTSALRRPSFQITAAIRSEIEKIVDARIREAHVTREDFSELKKVVGELAVAQKELAEAQKRTEQRVNELAEAQKRTEQRVDRLEIVVQELAEAQKRTEERVQQLTIAQQRMTEEIAALARRLSKAEDRLGRVIGQNLEREYREKAYSYLGRVLRDIQVVSLQDLEADLERHLSEAELEDLILLDVLLRGKPRQPIAVPEIWLALEVSAVVDRVDVERAQRRAALLRKAGYLAVPAVAGEETTLGGAEAARTERVVLFEDGKRQYWEEAVARIIADA
ncbi:MAG: hypothetical protein N2559_02715 [Anaerolineae bacterium]|nr:hypothetical protein [Anaerolineae bacterium]